MAVAARRRHRRLRLRLRKSCCGFHAPCSASSRPSLAPAAVPVSADRSWDVGSDRIHAVGSRSGPSGPDESGHYERARTIRVSAHESTTHRRPGGSPPIAQPACFSRRPGGRGRANWVRACKHAGRPWSPRGWRAPTLPVFRQIPGRPPNRARGFGARIHAVRRAEGLLGGPDESGRYEHRVDPVNRVTTSTDRRPIRPSTTRGRGFPARRGRAVRSRTRGRTSPRWSEGSRLRARAARGGSRASGRAGPGRPRGRSGDPNRSR